MAVDWDGVWFVYILKSQAASERYYTGITVDLRARLQRHNDGLVPSTKSNRPWAVKTYVAFSDADQALAFERYLKSSSGRAFAKKRL